MITAIGILLVCILGLASFVIGMALVVGDSFFGGGNKTFGAVLAVSSLVITWYTLYTNLEVVK